MSKNKPRVAVLYMIAGRYEIFFNDFYSTCEKFFLPNSEKHYFIFTDSKNPNLSRENISKIPYTFKGWPYDTLLRFETFLLLKNDLKDFDYIFFFNANVKFEDVISEEEILPNENDKCGLVCSTHPLMSKLRNFEYPYERNPNSKAYIPLGEGTLYTQGAFFGGTSRAFIELSEVCKRNIEEDLKKQIIAVWHDESHLNKYILNMRPKALPLEYLCPDTRKYRRRCKGKPKILLLEKNSYKYGGIEYLRGKRSSPISFLEFTLKKIFKFIPKLKSLVHKS